VFDKADHLIQFFTGYPGQLAVFERVVVEDVETGKKLLEGQ